MVMLQHSIITDALPPSDTIGYYVSQRLAVERPDRALLRVGANGFDLAGYARAGHCLCTPSSAMHAETIHWWAGPAAGLKSRAQNAWFEVTWDDERLDALQLGEEAIPHFADQTEGFSFAYLKELCVSSTMRWIEARTPGAMAECMREQLAFLRGQLPAGTASRVGGGRSLRRGPARWSGRLLTPRS